MIILRYWPKNPKKSTYTSSQNNSPTVCRRQPLPEFLRTFKHYLYVREVSRNGEVCVSYKRLCKIFGSVSMFRYRSSPETWAKSYQSLEVKGSDRVHGNSALRNIPLIFGLSSAINGISGLQNNCLVTLAADGAFPVPFLSLRMR